MWVLGEYNTMRELNDKVPRFFSLEKQRAFRSGVCVMGGIILCANSTTRSLSLSLYASYNLARHVQKRERDLVVEWAHASDNLA